MRRITKKQLAFILIMLLSLNICGCAVPQKNVERRDVSVSGNDGRQGKKDTSQGEGISSELLTNPFVTKNCIYQMDEYNEELTQTDLQGKHKKVIQLPEGFWDVSGQIENVQISDEHICYVKDAGLFVSPIRQTEEGEEIIWKEEEEIKIADLDSDLVDVVCIWEPYLICMVDDTMYRYDFREKKSESLENKEEFDDPNFYENYWSMPVVYEGKLYASAYDDVKRQDNDTIYRVDIEEWKAEKLSSIVREGLISSSLVGIKDSLLCVAIRPDGNNEESDRWGEFMVCFDTETNKETVLTEKELFGLLDKEKLWEKGYHRWELEDAFQCGGRTYLVMDLMWTQTRKVDFGPEKGKETEVWAHKPVLLSCPLDNIKELSYEKELSEWLYSRAERVWSVDEEDAYEEFMQADIYTLYQGELYMDYSDNKGSHMIAYSMQTGEYREVSGEETAYSLFSELSDLE